MEYRPTRQSALAAAEALAPFIAEHYHATGEDLADAAAADSRLMGLASVYAELPAVVEEAARRAAREHPRDPEASAYHQALGAEANQLLNDTAEAIRHRLERLRGRDGGHSNRKP